MLREYDGLTCTRKSSSSCSNAATATLNSRGRHGGSKNRKTASRPRMSAAELANAKLTQPCRQCGQLGHWNDAHNADGSLKQGTPSIAPTPLRLRRMLTKATQTAAATSRRMINRNNLSWDSRHRSLHLWTPRLRLTNSFVCHPHRLGTPKYTQ